MELRALIADRDTAADDALVAPRLEVVVAHGWRAEARLVELQRALTLQQDLSTRFRAFVDVLRDDPWLAPGLADDAAAALLAAARGTPDAAQVLATPLAGARLGQARREALLAVHARDVDDGCVAFFVDVGAGLPWREDALLARARCFAERAPERLDDADAALRTFRANAPARFVVDALTPASP
jgi:hypothetical protein